VLVAVAVVVGTLDGFFLPAVAALPVRIAPPHLIGRVAGLRTLTQRLGMLGGGPLAGWLIYLSGPSAAFLGSAVLFALSVGSLALVTLTPRRSPAPTAAPGTDTAAAGPGAAPSVLARAWAETTTGFQIVRASPVLAGLLLLIGGMNVGFSGPFTAAIPLLAAAHGWGGPGAGLLIGAFGTGAAVSGLSLCLLKRVPRAGLVQLAAVLSMGLAIGVVGVAPTLPVALAAAAVLGLSSGVFGTIAYALLLASTPAAEVGRVMALLSLTLEGSAALSFLATGTLTTTLGASVTFLLGGLLIVATTLTGSTRPHLRGLQMNQAETATQAKPVQHEPAVRTEPATQLALTPSTRQQFSGRRPRAAVLRVAPPRWMGGATSVSSQPSMGRIR
jgi:MFS family permease